MSERVYVTWSVSNWLTVVLMVMIAGLVLNAAAIGYQKAFGK